jgi:hypothetical protein
MSPQEIETHFSPLAADIRDTNYPAIAAAVKQHSQHTEEKLRELDATGRLGVHTFISGPYTDNLYVLHLFTPVEQTMMICVGDEKDSILADFMNHVEQHDVEVEGLASPDTSLEELPRSDTPKGYQTKGNRYIPKKKRLASPLIVPVLEGMEKHERQVLLEETARLHRGDIMEDTKRNKEAKNPVKGLCVASNYPAQGLTLVSRIGSKEPVLILHDIEFGQLYPLHSTGGWLDLGWISFEYVTLVE